MQTQYQVKVNGIKIGEGSNNYSDALRTYGSFKLLSFWRGAFIRLIELYDDEVTHRNPIKSQIAGAQAI